MKILCVHQGCELYGSDKTFIQSVKAFRKKYPEAYIKVLLPKEGPLNSQLVDYANNIGYEPLWILRKTTIKSLFGVGLFSLIKSSLFAWKLMNEFDKTYINTAVVLNFIIASFFSFSNRLIHVHEIPVGLSKYIFSLILSFARAPIVFNSKATQDAFFLPFWQKKTIVHNGVKTAENVNDKNIGPSDQLNILMIGRLNDGKGQELLLKALDEVPSKLLQKIKLKIVGDVFEEQVHFRDSLLKTVSDNDKLNAFIEFEGFSFTPNKFYQWCDIVIIPSKKPESFGLVAIEAMSFGKCVIAAKHGGLTEIIEEGKSGLFFEPNSVNSLKSVIVKLLLDKTLTTVIGENGKAHFLAHFTEDNYIRKIGLL
jgi:glycosyltransferase involved in cell wall biosynthesis